MGGFVNGGFSFQFFENFEILKISFFFVFFEIFEPGFGFLVIFCEICAIFRPKRCLGAEFWARTKFGNFRDCYPPI